MTKAQHDQHSDRRPWQAIVQGTIGGVLLGMAFAGGFLYRDFAGRPPPSPTTFGLLNEADGLLRDNYLRDLPDESIRVHGALKGMVAALNDPYTYFVEPRAAEMDTTRLAGSFGGTGVEIARSEKGEFIVGRVYRDSPSDKVGVKDGDIILSVDGVRLDTTSADEDSVRAAIQGEVGTQVVLTLERAGKTFNVTMTRTEIVVPSTYWKVLDVESLIGYVQIASFTERTSVEVRQAVQELGAKHVTGYVLDLRNNGGGLVDSAVKVAGVFLDGGVVLYERGRDSGERVFNAPRDGAAIDAPLVVLINSNTASAAEIVAGALQDRGRAKLIGQRSYGKGSVQVILPLSDGSSLHVTTAEWFTPNHHPLQGTGLTPDIATQPVKGQDNDLLEAARLIASLAGSPYPLEPTLLIP